MSASRPRAWRLVIGYAFALAGLIWVFHDVSWRALRPVFVRVRWTLVLAAVAADVASYFCQGLRWRLLLERQGRLSLLSATRAIYAGLFVNELLPLRAGEFLRAWLAARALRISATGIFPSIAVERLLDTLWLAAAVVVIGVALPLPPAWTRMAGAIVTLLVLGTLAFAVLVLRTPPREDPEAGRVRRFLAGQACGIHAIGRSGKLIAAGVASGGVLLLQGVAYWLVVRACGIEIGIARGLAAFLVVHAGTAIPNAPGNAGAYQLFAVLGLTVFGVSKGEAAAVSVAAFVILTAPLWALGWLALSRSHLTLRAAKAFARHPNAAA